MNILFFIFTYGDHASGGHYHSLNQISKEVSRTNNVRIITLGLSKSPIILENPFFVEHIFVYNKIADYFVLNTELKKIFKRFKANVLHCFDTESLNMLLVLPSTFKYPIILNKCGGPNPKRKNFQHANEIIVFSNENYKWFETNKNYTNESVHLIPNRVAKPQFLEKNIYLEEKDNNTITFLRVTRIGGAYEKTLNDSIRMIEELMLRYPVRLIIVGRIQDQERYQWYYKEITGRNLPVVFITDERASNGSSFLYLADFVIGTGRSLMESMSLGIPTLTPAINCDWPVLVNERNFHDFFHTNFSERNIADEETICTNKDEIYKLMDNRGIYNAAKESAELLYEKYFGTKLISQKYSSVYKQACSKPKQRLRLILKNFYYIIWYRFK